MGSPLNTGIVRHLIYVYTPEQTNYTPISIPEDVADKQSCPGLWSIERLPQRKALRNSCNSGIFRGYETLRFEADQSFWISEQTVMEEYPDGWPYFSKPARMGSTSEKTIALFGAR